MLVSDIKRRADELAAFSAKIKYLSKEAKLEEITQTISESQKQLPAILEAPMQRSSNYASLLLIDQPERISASLSKARSRHIPPQKPN